MFFRFFLCLQVVSGTLWSFAKNSFWKFLPASITAGCFVSSCTSCFNTLFFWEAFVMKFKRVTRIAAALAIAGIAQSAWAQQAIKVALPGPTTGSVAQYGDIVRTGAMVAIDAINT